MPRKKQTVPKEKTRGSSVPKRRTTNPEDQEQYLVNLAMSVAEEQMREGTASPSIITHFLKLGSAREKKEQALVEYRAELLKSQAENIKSNERSEEVTQQALDAFKSYAPTKDDE